MRHDRELGPVFRSLPDAVRAPLHADYAERRLSPAAAYCAWACLGSHYLYLRRPVVQLAFWLTLGGLLIWWISDFFRLGGVVARKNREAAQEVERESERLIIRQIWRSPFPGEEYREQRARVDDEVEELAPAPAAPVPPAGPRRGISRPAAVALGGLATAVALCAFIPAPVYPAADRGERYRAVREVNVRAAPTTASAVRSQVPEGEILRGAVEAGQNGRWLRIDRGPNNGGYVFAQNLERQG